MQTLYQLTYRCRLLCW